MAGLGTDLLGDAIATTRNLSRGAAVAAGTVAVLATGHTLRLLTGLVACEGLGVTLVLLRVGAVCIFETSHAAVVLHIASAAFAIGVGQAGHTLRSLGVTHLTTGAIRGLTTACHTSLGAVADEAATTVRILVTTNTALGGCVTHATHSVVEGATVGVL